MTDTARTIPIHPLAPAKVPEGAACNGCGVCCLYEPCPLGMLLSRRRTGTCLALRWQHDRYRCGALVDTRTVLAQVFAHRVRCLQPALAWGLRRIGGRWIAVGTGCDCDLQVVVDAAHSTTIGVTSSSHP